MFWWFSFIQVFSGHTHMVDPWPLAPLTIDAYTEAAGVHCLGRSLYTPWASCWPDAAKLHINHKKVLVLEPAATTFVPMWANKNIYVHSDNRNAVCTIKKDVSKHHLPVASLRQVF